MTRTTRWTPRAADADVVQRIARRNKLSHPAASFLATRGHSDPEAVDVHLQASPHGLHDPFLLPGMEAAADRLTRAVEGGETILVHGDYDVDGVTGTALLVRLLRLVGAQAEWHIPNRFTDGYSFGEHSLRRAEATGATVVISVDNGTSAFETIAQLAERGIDTIVTDHHEPPAAHPKYGELPCATAIVNPKLEGSTYPWRELCGGAVAFKLAWGLCQRLSGAQRVRSDLKLFLEDAMAYVAIATVSDVVPLLDENRIFARWGLKSLEGTENPGLRALIDICGIGGRALNGEDVGFQIGPRINASGRLGSAQKAVDLLLANDAGEARALALQLDELNRERRRIEADVHVEARAQARDFRDPQEYPVLVLAGEAWHQGVVGIVAARMVEEFSRPAVVIGLDGAAGRGSARSVPGFSVLDAMHGASELLERYGGHEQAAGLEIQTERVADVRAAICRRAREILNGGDYPDPELTIDLDLPFGQMNADLMRELDQLGPFGAQNEKPIFLSRGLRLSAPPRAVGREQGHLLLHVRDGEHELKAMAFGQGKRIEELRLGTTLDAVYTPRWNTFRGETNLEIEIHEFELRE